MIQPREAFRIRDEVATRFPGIKVGTALIRDATVDNRSREVDVYRVAIEGRIKARLEGVDLSQLPRVQGFRAIYRGFGANPGETRPSAEALLRRIVHGKGLYVINAVVDICNALSALHQLPIAAYDFDRVSCPVELRFSKEGEGHTPIGQDRPDRLRDGELVYADADRVMCRNFNYRDSEFTKVDSSSKNLLVFVDGCECVTPSELRTALVEVAETLASFCGGTICFLQVFPEGHP